MTAVLVAYCLPFFANCLVYFSSIGLILLWECYWMALSWLYFLCWSHLAWWDRSSWNLRSLSVGWEGRWDLRVRLNKSSSFVPLQSLLPYLGRKGTVLLYKHGYFFMSLLSMRYIKHTGNGQSGDNRSCKENVINRKPECSTVKHSGNGLPGENKVMKGTWLKGIKMA